MNIALLKAVLHAKTVVIDDDYCLFGTVNMDMRAYLNMGLVMLYTPSIVEQVHTCQQAYLTQCELQFENGRVDPLTNSFDSGIRLFVL